MEFKKLSKQDIEASLSYIIATTILNKTREFTINELAADIIPKLGHYVTKDELISLKTAIDKKLEILMTNGQVVNINNGDYYDVRECI